MKALVTHQFNKAMLSLTPQMQREVSGFYSLANSVDKEHLMASSFTQITSENNDIFTLRGNNVRIFCTFTTEDGEESIVFLDAKPVGGFGYTSKLNDLQGEITLFGAQGEPIAYIEDTDDKTIFTFNGEPLAYIDDDNNIYGYNGSHLGWYEDQIIWDHSGNRVGFTKNTCPSFTQFEPFKGFKQFKPFKSFKQFAPFKPFKSSNLSSIGLLEFIKEGR